MIAGEFAGGCGIGENAVHVSGQSLPGHGRRRPAAAGMIPRNNAARRVMPADRRAGRKVPERILRDFLPENSDVSLRGGAVSAVLTGRRSG